MLYQKFKRIFDILFSFILLVVFSIPLFLTGFLIWITDRGDVFVKDPLRIGKNGENFRMYKFRTMIPNAHNEMMNNSKYSEIKKKWEKPGVKLTISEDPRITWIGKLLRRTDMDELPQLLNVLNGDMSLIGPRPMYEDEIKQYLLKNPGDKKYLKKCTLVVPGITGIWQVSGRNDISFKDRIRMEAKYTQSVNLTDDLKILLKTPYVVLSRKGVHE